VRNLIESGGLAKHIAHLRQEYAHRLTVMDAAMRQVLPQAEYRPPQGGFFFWVRLPGVDTAALRRKAQRFNVDLRQGALFSSQEGQNEYMRLSFAYYGAGQIETGLQRLGACIG
jgi:2-aminoadipate transaminase